MLCIVPTFNIKLTFKKIVGMHSIFCIFTKKATGRITFTCNQGNAIKETIQKAIDTNEGQTIWLTSIGKNEKGEQVSEMQFEWTIKVRA